MALAIVLSCKPLVAPRPLAFKRTLLVVGSNVPSEVKVPGKGAAASRDRTLEVGLSGATIGAGLAGSRRCNMDPLDRLGQGKAAIVGTIIARQQTRARVRAVIWARTVRPASGSFMASAPGSDATFVHIRRCARWDRHGGRSEGAICRSVHLSALSVQFRDTEGGDVFAPSVSDMTSAAVAITDGARSLAGRRPQPAEHGIDRAAVPEGAADTEPDIGDTTAGQKVWID